MRLVTRADFDGLACAVLLEEMGIVSTYKFVHPKDIQDGKVQVNNNDVLANVPYCHGCGLWFDHHSSEMERLQLNDDFKIGSAPRIFNGVSKHAPSCARVIYDYYGGVQELKKFDDSGLMKAVDQSDMADFTIDEIMSPSGWVLVSFIIDARTGLHRYPFRIEAEQFVRDMIGYCRTISLEQILKLPDVEERVNTYFEQEEKYREMIKNNSRIEKNITILDLRNVDPIYSGNRFIEHAMFPEQNISVRVFWKRDHKTIFITAGRNIINRSSNINIGSLMLAYGGGGHERVGTCQVAPENAERILGEILYRLKSEG